MGWLQCRLNFCLQFNSFWCVTSRVQFPFWKSFFTIWPASTCYGWPLLKLSFFTFIACIVFRIALFSLSLIIFVCSKRWSSLSFLLLWEDIQSPSRSLEVLGKLTCLKNLEGVALVLRIFSIRYFEVRDYSTTSSQYLFRVRKAYSSSGCSSLIKLRSFEKCLLLHYFQAKY